MQRFSHTILARLLIVFLFIALPMTFITVYFINRTLTLQDQQNQVVLEQTLDTAVASLENRLAAMQGHVLSLCSERSLSLLAARPEDITDFDRAMAITSYQKRLETLQTGSPHVLQLSLVIPRLSLRLNAIQSQPDCPLVEIIDDEKAQAFFDAGKAVGNHFTVTEAGLSYYHQLPLLLSYKRQDPPRIMLRIDYDLQAICLEMCQPTLGAQVRCAVLDSAGQLLYATGETELLTALYARFWPEAAEGLIVAHEDGASYYARGYSSQLADMRLFFCVSREEALGPTLHTRVWLYLICVLFMVSLIIYGYYAYSRVQIPMDRLLDAFGRLEKGEMDFRVDYRRHNEFGLLATRFNETLQRLKQLVTDLYEQRILTQQAEMKHLQAQINPHFLYNTFYILDNMLLMEDHENASILCRQLGNYFRYVTRSDQSFAHLSEEIRHCRSYVEIQQIRFQGELQVSFPEPPSDLDDPMVPRLILQPILENAFKHSLEHMSGERGLWVQFAQDETYIYITVENSGAPLDEKAMSALTCAALNPNANSASTGLSNVEKRLRMSHGTGLTFRARQEGGLYVAITLRRNVTPDELSRCGL